LSALILLVLIKKLIISVLEIASSFELRNLIKAIMKFTIGELFKSNDSDEITLIFSLTKKRAILLAFLLFLHKIAMSLS